jgi:pyrrolidone-carboxylate peptidase
MKITLIIMILILSLSASALARPVVMLTGYWSPTSEMIHRFSPDPDLNPDGWIGENWEDFGYDVYAFFPAFNKNSREFEVDYQATSRDFWNRAREFNPEIIISWGAGAGPWEIEDDAFNWDSWVADEIAPYYPTPNPPDSTLAANRARYSTLPMEEISAAVNDQTNVYAWIDWNGNPGNYLCNYIAYLGMWYQSMHASPSDEHYCRAAGFIHVAGGLPVPDATLAAEVTLRTTLEYMAYLADANDQVSSNIELAQLSSYPNPFNRQTTIRYHQQTDSPLQVHIIGPAGNLIRSLNDGGSSNGVQSVVWDGRDASGQPVSSGVYFYRVNQPDSPLRKIVLMK